MNEAREEMLKDAIKATLRYSIIVERLKKVILVLCVIIFMLISGNFM